MLAEFSVVPIGVGESLSRYVAECVGIVERSGLNYRLHAMGTVLEGEYDEVMDVIGECHKRVSSMCPRVMTNISIDDRRGHAGAIESKVTAVLSKVEKG